MVSFQKERISCPCQGDKTLQIPTDASAEVCLSLPKSLESEIISHGNLRLKEISGFVAAPIIKSVKHLRDSFQGNLWLRLHLENAGLCVSRYKVQVEHPSAVHIPPKFK
jgi:hypothetical protein